MRTLFALLATSLMAVQPVAATAIDRKVPTTKEQQKRSDAVERAFKFIGNLDQQQLFEKAYAERILVELDIIRGSDLYEGEVRDATDLLRLIALGGAGRDAEAMAFADTLVARRASDPAIYWIAFSYAAKSNPQKAVAFLELAERNLIDPEAREGFRGDLEDDVVWPINRALLKAKDESTRARLAEVLLKLDWPGDAKPGDQDYQRITALEARLKKGDIAGARMLARQIVTPATALELFIVKTYDAAVDVPDREARIAALIAVEDARTTKALSAKPDDLKLILERTQFLRSIGRDDEALALLLPRTVDMTIVEKGGRDAFWIVNDAAYALSALGRYDEAIALMRRLLALDLARHPDLINMAINLAVVMNDAGRHREAAAYAEDLFRAHPTKASKYGHMWMWQAAACGHAMGGNMAAARPWVAKLRADPDTNRSAVMRALMCTNDLDGAAAQLIERLDGDGAGGMMAHVQEYTIATGQSRLAKALDPRLRHLLARPDVVAAIRSKGRVLKLPLPRSYWGMF